MVPKESRTSLNGQNSGMRANKDIGKFWKATGKLDIKPGLPASVNGKGDTEEIANLFMNHFKVRSPFGPSASTVNSESYERGEEPLLDLSANQIRKIFKGMSRSKSPDHDGLSIEHLKYAGVHLPRLLSMFFSMCINHSYLPTDLMRTTVVPIVKNRTGDISDKGNYHPISLATTIAWTVCLTRC